MKALLFVLFLFSSFAHAQFVNNALYELTELSLSEAVPLIEDDTHAQLSLFVVAKASNTQAYFQPVTTSQLHLYSVKENETAFVQAYSWRHFRENGQLESAFTPEINIAYKLNASSDSSLNYNLGLALVRPSQQSMAFNGALTPDDDRLSTFLSLSLHSRF